MAYTHTHTGVCTRSPRCCGNRLVVVVVVVVVVVGLNWDTFIVCRGSVLIPSERCSSCPALTIYLHLKACPQHNPSQQPVITVITVMK